MFPLIGATLSVLRVASHVSLFLEAQRLLLTCLRPTRGDVVAKLEAKLLKNVKATVQHIWVEDANQNLVHVIQVTAAGTTPNKVAVLLHGHSMAAAYWYRNMDHFTHLGYRILAIDLLGWGRSQRPTFQGSTANHTTAWFLDSLHTVISKLVPSSVPLVIIGHSLGAYLAYELSRFCENIQPAKLILVSPAAAVRSIPFSRALYFSLPPQMIVRRGGLLGFLFFTLKYPKSEHYLRDNLRDFTYRLAMQTPSSGESAIRPIIRFRGWRTAECVRPLIEHIDPRTKHIPTLIICGDSDSSMPIDGVFQLYRKLKAHNHDVRLDVFKNCDHCPQLEKPQTFFASVAQFLQ